MFLNQDSKTSYGQLFILLLICTVITHLLTLQSCKKCNNAEAAAVQVVSDDSYANADVTMHPYLRPQISVRTNNIKNPVALISQEIFVNWISMYNIGTLLEYDDEEVERIEWADYSLDDDGNCICEVRISLTKNTGSMDLVDFVKIFDLEQRKSIKKIYSRSTPGYAEAQAKIIEQ